MANERGDAVQGNELEEIRGDIRAVVSKLDRIIAERKTSKVEIEQGN